MNQPFVGKEECMSVENKQKDTAEILSLLNQELDEAAPATQTPIEQEIVSEKAAAAMEAVGVQPDSADSESRTGSSRQKSRNCPKIKAESTKTR